MSMQEAVSELLMDSFSVVERFDVLEHARVGILQRFEGFKLCTESHLF